MSADALWPSVWQLAVGPDGGGVRLRLARSIVGVRMLMGVGRQAARSSVVEPFAVATAVSGCAAMACRW